MGDERDGCDECYRVFREEITREYNAKKRTAQQYGEYKRWVIDLCRRVLAVLENPDSADHDILKNQLHRWIEAWDKIHPKDNG